MKGRREINGSDMQVGSEVNSGLGACLEILKRVCLGK